MASAPLELVTGWYSTKGRKPFRVRLSDIRGASIPRSVILRLGNDDYFRIPPMPPESNCVQRADQIRNALGQLLPVPDPLEMAGYAYEGCVGKLGDLSSPPPIDEGISLWYDIAYSNGMQDRRRHDWQLAELPPAVRNMVEQLDRDVNRHVLTAFNQEYGAGEVDPARWKAVKTEVFISYRGDREQDAAKLFEGLGEYENRTLFIPRLDKVDMQAGSWLEQLSKLIADASVFIPILSSSYLKGPVARPECEQALQEQFRDPARKIIPVLVEGTPEDYVHHFIGRYQMVQALGGVTADTVNEVAHLCLGLSRNPYE